MPITFNQDTLSLWIRPVIKDSNGNDTTIENPSWSSSNEALVAIDAQGDGGAVHIIHGARNQTGTATLALEGDADLGQGVVPISHSEEIVVGPGNAASIEFEVVE